MKNFKIQRCSSQPLTYDATEKTTAAYLMVNTRIEDLHISGGLRMENTNQGYKLYFPQGESKPEMNQIIQITCWKP